MLHKGREIIIPNPVPANGFVRGYEQGKQMIEVDAPGMLYHELLVPAWPPTDFVNEGEPVAFILCGMGNPPTPTALGPYSIGS